MCIPYITAELDIQIFQNRETCANEHSGKGSEKLIFIDLVTNVPLLWKHNPHYRACRTPV
jgi:hypothetical protein